VVGVVHRIADTHAAYNDINTCRYDHLLALFNHPDPRSAYRRANTKAELDAILDAPELRKADTVQVVELILDQMDVPLQLVKLLEMRGEAQVKYMKENGFIK